MRRKYNPVVGDVIRPYNYPNVAYLVVEVDLSSDEVEIILLKQDPVHIKGILHKVQVIGLETIQQDSIYIRRALKGEKVLYGL